MAKVLSETTRIFPYLLQVLKERGDNIMIKKEQEIKVREEEK